MLRKSLLLIMFFAGAAIADTGLDAVKALGQLNGEALACQQMALVERIRMLIIYDAPKTREVGEAFEAATTERFLALGESKASCSDTKALAGRIEETSQALRAIYAEAMGRKP